MVNMHPDELFVQLQENASVRKKRTLELIHGICKKQYENGKKDFSIGTIARLITEDGGPSEQALRNKQGEDYRALIKQWTDYSNGSNRKIAKQKSTGINDEILANVTDPTTKAFVGMILAENKKLKRENSLLKERTTTTIDMRPKDEVFGNGQNVILVSPSHDLTDTELKALREAISDDFMKDRGWTVDDYGRVKEKGIQVYKPGYITAIKKVLKEV